MILDDNRINVLVLWTFPIKCHFFIVLNPHILVKWLSTSCTSHLNPLRSFMFKYCIFYHENSHMFICSFYEITLYRLYYRTACRNLSLWTSLFYNINPCKLLSWDQEFSLLCDILPSCLFLSLGAVSPVKPWLTVYGFTVAI